ncbi:hypothetical protein [Turneriella parva]|uniref:GAF domain-containing protein n=1 Tax=Turneriella parva (strain ATCC BAA-1111 / DSM 21527 / NCTC 11395 / H) TaxID=869212 RepID=I4B7V7_TURPD|nr:hypothetical protein [Turneriella parva]AFM13364.1 hypothetical protein Turpa_2725 [Turneriella parva DSM 21527]
MFWQRVRSLPWWAISLSLGVNIISLMAAIFAISQFRDELPVVVVAFLFVHIFVAQPVKDFIISRMGLGARYSTQASFVSFDNRVSRITRLGDVLDFLSWLIRAWRIGRLRLLVFDNEDFIYYFALGKKPRKMRLRDELTDAFRDEIAADKTSRAISSLSTPLKNYMQSRKVKFITPVMFRDRLIGLIGFNDILDRARLPLIDHAAHRIGLALENEQLERTVPRSEFLKKEFKLAERIERHLSGVSHYQAGTFAIQKLDTAWDKKHFAAIFGCTQGSGEQGGAAIYFAMLLRLNVASTRSNALQLFSAQGYFYSLCRNQTNVEGLASAMNRSLVENENGAIVLEGFLVGFHSAENRLRLITFGSHLAYRDQSGWTWIKENGLLGIRGFEPSGAFDLYPGKEVILSMREYPLLMISGGRA